MCVAVAADGYQLSVVSSAYTRYQAGNKARGRYLGQTTPREEPRAGDFGGQLQTHGTENGTPCAEPTTCTTLFADRNKLLEVMPPNALQAAVAYRMCAQVINPGPRTQCDLQQKANSGRSSPRKKMCVLSTALTKRRPQSPNYLLQSRVNNLLWILWYNLAQ